MIYCVSVQQKIISETNINSTVCVDEQICVCVCVCVCLGGFDVGEEGMWVRRPRGSSVSGGGGAEARRHYIST